MLSNSDIVELTQFRCHLHEKPELSGEEYETAKMVTEFMQNTVPDEVLTDLGETGVALVYNGAEPGPTVMVRAELDALPIEELTEVAHKSQIAGKGHLCGHDGHMVMVCAVGRMMAKQRPAKGRVVLLFQPAEETGQGARAVRDDARFAQIKPDVALSLHNLPGLPLGHVAIAEGPANCASRGIRIELTGKTAHASMPETGVSPMQAVAALMPGLTELGSGGKLVPGYRLVTVTHAEMGEAVFGVTPGHAVVLGTLRCLQDADMATLCEEAEALISEVAKRDGLQVKLSYHDVFHACTNAADPTAVLKRAVEQRNVPLIEDAGPMRWSEDFGLFGYGAQSAMFLLGSGTDQPQLHNPDYDFPDDLIPVGAGIFEAAIREILG
ncbi:amidohydrolase [Halocynthiibacter styelae]|uniref:Amidohydrolase n=1 Tax=Halocynthiibacter styelae TaxID=2761955 RepID=A0A8J7IBQ9_9RHOB|nr:amidohydrolase [Paenihalocynthiibacter styelae]MBI1492493.1 amidohydrolase [Paenihalocynthiibacter styelae]